MVYKMTTTVENDDSWYRWSDRWCHYPEGFLKLFHNFFVSSPHTHPSYSSTPIHWIGNPHHLGRGSVLLDNDAHDPMREWVQYWTELDQMFQQQDQGPWILTMDIPAHLVEAAIRHHVPSITIIHRVKAEEVRNASFQTNRVFLECVMYNLVKKGFEVRVG
jgi:hypothetical protein